MHSKLGIVTPNPTLHSKVFLMSGLFWIMTAYTFSANENR